MEREDRKRRSERGGQKEEDRKRKIERAELKEPVKVHASKEELGEPFAVNVKQEHLGVCRTVLDPLTHTQDLMVLEAPDSPDALSLRLWRSK
ncbi:hypothetical protein RRG08_040817 [Elysia crispata]|uniref:Uncharacterized protein n=1 Tax=Elysia crispata TaxID=231223 RepID=A0AAE0ZAI4_9GAST|nr:hypothetical protein RRG08_040817 [Elysia crispata]